MFKNKVLLLVIVLLAILAFSYTVQARIANAGESDFNLQSMSKAMEAALEDYGVLPPLRIEEIYVSAPGGERVLRQEEAEVAYGNLRFTLSNLEMNEATSRFTAELVADTFKGPDIPLDVYTIRGKVTKLVDIPVLNKTIRNGDVITSRDIEWETYPERKLNPSIILSEEALIGKTPSLRVQPNKVIRVRDVEAPILVKKGKAVNLIYQTEYMQLQAIGLALEDGRMGDSIRIENTKSKKVISAIVQDKGLAVVNFQALNPGVLASNF